MEEILSSPHSLRNLLSCSQVNFIFVFTLFACQNWLVYANAI